MPVQFKFFLIPTHGPSDPEDDLNRFLRSVRTLAVHREFVLDGANSFWCFAVEYLADHGAEKENRPKKGRVDYREILSPEDFTLFVSLRDWRKDVAGREAIPVYTVFTNEQLAHIARAKPKSRTELARIGGIGDARMKKYGDEVLRITSEMLSGAAKETDRE